MEAGVTEPEEPATELACEGVELAATVRSVVALTGSSDGCPPCNPV